MTSDHFHSYSLTLLLLLCACVFIVRVEINFKANMCPMRKVFCFVFLSKYADEVIMR